MPIEKARTGARSKSGLISVITRRRFLKAAGGSVLGLVSVPSYALGVEPMRLAVTRYAVSPPGWPVGLKLSLAVLADFHACAPWMTPERIAYICDTANGLGADTVLLLGDYVASHRFVTGRVPAGEWAHAMAGLKAPLGVHAILGNHDWWDDHQAQRLGHGPVLGRRALEKHGLPVYENNAIRLRKDGQPFWLAGLGDQMALVRSKKLGRCCTKGVDDLAGTLAGITDNAPVILMAHEPDIFPDVPHRVALTLAGHTHGGQIRVMGYSPLKPSRYGSRYTYGHVVERDRDMIISGGLGCSIAPVRLGVPPEIVLVELSA